MRIGVVFLFCLISWTLTSQKYHFNQHEVSTDLLRMNPTLLYRYQNDLMYIGTKEGLVIYDGNIHKIYQRPDQGSQEVTALYYEKNILWIGYEDGAIFQFYKNGIHPWGIDEGWPKSKITDIFFTPSNQFWIATYGEGVYVYEDKVLYNINEDDGLFSNEIYSMVATKNEGIWVATDLGVQELHFDKGKKKVLKPSVAASLPDDVVTSIYPSKSGQNLGLGTFKSGVWDIDVTKQQVKSNIGLSESVVKLQQLFFDTYLIQTENKENIYIWNTTTDELKPLVAKGHESSLSIIDFLVDDEKNIWFLCRNNGLLSASGTLTISQTNIQNIQTIRNIDDKTYVGNETGLFVVDHNQVSKNIIPNVNIISLYYHQPSKALWCGTMDRGIIILDMFQNKTRTIQESNGLSNNSVFSITYQGDKIWASTLAGISILDEDGQVLEVKNKQNGLVSDYNYTLFTDKSDNIWIGSDGKGIQKINKNNQIKNYVSDHTILSFAQDKNDVIWFSTLDEGVGCIKNDSIQYFGTEEGLTELHISGVKTDRYGQIIVFHHTGFDLINVDNYQIVNFGNNVGIRKWDQNINAFCQDQQDNILMTDNDKIIYYRALQDVKYTPKLHINKLKAGETWLNDNTILSHTENDFVIEYAGIWFNDPEAVRYRFQLSDVDEGWRFTKDQKLIYSNLKPGTYKFIIECAINENFAFADKFEINFTIKEAFWRTWWFILCVIGLLVWVIFKIFDIVSERKKTLEAIKTEQVKNQLETLKSQINPHFLFNSFNTLISVIEYKPEQAVTFVEKLSDFYRSILQYRETEVISLEEEVTIMENYRFLLEQRFGKSIEISVNISNPKTYMILPLTLQLLIENAVKHNVVSKNKPLIIHITQTDENLKICNNLQPKLSVEVSTHFGLQSLSKRYVHLLGKDIIINKTADEFCITIPLKKTI